MAINAEGGKVLPPLFNLIGNTNSLRIAIEIDAANRRPVQIEFFDRKEALQKTLTYSDWKTFDKNIDRAQTWTMVNHQTGKQTVLRFRDFKFKSGLDEGDFSQAKLKNVR